MITIQGHKFGLIKFPGGEQHVRLLEVHHFPPSVVIRADIRNSDDLMILLLLTDALRRRSVTTIHLLMPYLPYARQDRVAIEGESLSLKVFCDIINSQHYDSVEVWDCHSGVGTALLNNVRNRSAIEFVQAAIKDRLHRDNYVLVAPDAGATKKVSAIAKELALPMVQATKHRDPVNGLIMGTHIEIDPKDESNYWEKKFLVVDDICDGGRTFLALAKQLNPLSQFMPDLYVTHGIFSNGFKELNEAFYHIYCANSWHPENDNVQVLPAPCGRLI